MQFMEQIHHIPVPTMASSWGGTAIGKILFSLMLAVCVLIGIAKYGTDSPTRQPMNQVEMGPTEVVLLAPISGATRSSVPVASIQVENHPPAASSGTSGDQGRQLAARGTTLERKGSAQQPAGAVENRSETWIFSGHVVDSTGTPVAEAQIRYAMMFYPFGEDAVSSSSYSAQNFFTRTEMDGTFRFELPSKLRWIPMDSTDMLRRLNIAVTYPDHAVWWQEIPFQSTVDIGIQLEMPEMVSGKVTNEGGELIQGAEVQIRSVSRGDPMLRERKNSLKHDALPQPVKTDASGEFVILGLPQDATMTLDVKGPGYAKENRHNVLVSAKKRLEFQLKREGRIKGRLTYADTGAPITHAMVRCALVRPNYGGGQARVDANGDYLLANLAPGTYSVYLAKGPKGWTAIPKESISVSEGKTVSNVDLTLIQSGFVTGRVTNRDTNEPIVNYFIRLKDAARPEGSQLMDHYALTDETGAYRFDAVPGRALVHTNLPVGYQDSGQIERPDIRQIRRHVDVVEGETVVVDFQYSGGRR